MKRNKFLDPDHPFFAPVWRRWASGLIPLCWGAFEFWNQSPFWGIMFIAAGVYALYMLVFIGPSGSE